MSTKEQFFSKNTFLGLLRSKSACAGKVDIFVPPESGKGQEYVVSGLLSDEFSLSLGNTWGSVLPDADTANQVAQILGMQSQITWIQSSASAWKSTQPLEFDMDVYLVTLTSDQSNIIADAKALMKMAALYVEKDDFATAKIHGGYKVDYGTSNNNLDKWTRTVNNDGKSEGGFDSEYNYFGDINSIGKTFANTQKGTIKVVINDNLVIKNLLLSKITVTHSSAYVNEFTPLYIKLGLSLRSNRALLTTDIDTLYGEI